jgi:hypothetical protein
MVLFFQPLFQKNHHKHGGHHKADACGIKFQKRANKSADELRTSSVTYATDVLKYVETNMENVLDSLKKNRQSLIDSNSAAARQQQEQQQSQDSSKK